MQTACFGNCCLGVDREFRSAGQYVYSKAWFAKASLRFCQRVVCQKRGKACNQARTCRLANLTLECTAAFHGRLEVGRQGSRYTSVANELGPGLLKCSASCQMHMEPLKSLVPFAPLGHLLSKGIKRQQLVGGPAGHQPGLLNCCNALDAGIHDLVSAAEAVGYDRKYRVIALAPQGAAPRPLHTALTFHSGKKDVNCCLSFFLANSIIF